MASALASSQALTGAAAAPAAAGGEAEYPPINFVYKHLHDAMRAELESIAALMASLEASAQEEAVVQQLETIQARFQLLGQINRYHSCVEDEVVYPALEFKVRNVTPAYSVEHGEEVRRGGGACGACGAAPEAAPHAAACRSCCSSTCRCWWRAR